MRAIVAIPHYFKPVAGSSYGSQRDDRGARERALLSCIAALRQSLSGAQGLLDGVEQCVRPANERYGCHVDVVVCTAGDEHVLSALPAHLYHHFRSGAQPMLLGYACHEVLRETLGHYDWYCYLEDDIVVTDGLFLDKIRWFNGVAQDPACVLLPNRFEVADGGPVAKLYVDGPPRRPETRVSQRPAEAGRERIVAPLFGGEAAFRRVENPHSGCFFLNAGQMARWAAMPDFLDESTDFVGPLESAATLGLIRHFNVYKPARENAAFLEVRHADPRYLDRLLDLSGFPALAVRAPQPRRT